MASTESALQDQKKRSLDALERRFAVAKAEILQQQKKSKKRSNEEDGEKEPQMKNTYAAASSSEQLNSPSLTPSSKSKKDGEANDPSYSGLSHPVHENLLLNNVKISSRRGNIVDKILHELLQNGDSAHKYTQGSRSMKIDNWIQLDNYVQKQSRSAGAHLRALQIHSRRSKVHMSMKQHKRRGSFDLPKGLHKFDIFKPMHDMWKDYMTELLKNVGKNQLAQFILGADLHGAVILVADCKINSFTGVNGIMIRETAETFGIITQDDKFRVVPKKASVFMLQVDSWKVTLRGDKLISRDSGL